MAPEFHGEATGAGRRVCVVVSRFNPMVTSALLDGAREELLRRGVADERIEVVWVPGAWELPVAATAAASRGYDAIVALGAVVRGETAHFDYICKAVVEGLTHLQLRERIPISLGVLTTDTLAQALERAGGSVGHAGVQAAQAALEMCDLLERLDAG